jgi:hypothetical protein
MPTVADNVIATLKASGVRRIYGLPGDSLNGFTDALRHDGEIEWIHVRHEEAAAIHHPALTSADQGVRLAPASRLTNERSANRGLNPRRANDPTLPATHRARKTGCRVGFGRDAIEAFPVRRYPYEERKVRSRNRWTREQR